MVFVAVFFGVILLMSLFGLIGGYEVLSALVVAVLIAVVGARRRLRRG